MNVVIDIEGLYESEVVVFSEGVGGGGEKRFGAVGLNRDFDRVLHPLCK